MALLWALAIVVFFLTSGRVNKAVSKDYDRSLKAEVERENYDYQEFRGKCVDYELEHFARIESNIPEKQRELRETLFDVIGCEPTGKMVYLAIMAMHGKIPHNTIKKGISCYPGGADNYEVSQNWESVRKFLLWYNQTLRQHGVEEDLLFLEHNDKNGGTLTNQKMSRTVSADNLPLNYAKGVCFWRSSHTWVFSLGGESLITEG